MQKLLSTLIKLRQAKNYSQSFVAYQLGVSQKKYSFIESGKIRLRIEELIEIAKILEINPCDLLRISGMTEGFPHSEEHCKINEQTRLIQELQEKCNFMEKVNRKLLG